MVRLILIVSFAVYSGNVISMAQKEGVMEDNLKVEPQQQQTNQANNFQNKPNQPFQNQPYQTPSFQQNRPIYNTMYQGFFPSTNSILQSLFGSFLPSPINQILHTPQFPVFGGYARPQSAPQLTAKHSATVINNNQDPSVQGQPIAGLHPPAPSSHQDTAAAHANWFQSQMQNTQQIFSNWLKNR